MPRHILEGHPRGSLQTNENGSHFMHTSEASEKVGLQKFSLSCFCFLFQSFANKVLFPFNMRAD